MKTIHAGILETELFSSYLALAFIVLYQERTLYISDILGHSCIYLTLTHICLFQ